MPASAMMAPISGLAACCRQHTAPLSRDLDAAFRTIKDVANRTVVACSLKYRRSHFVGEAI
jgi:hypothetical protein